MKYLLGLDIGTSSVKAIASDINGKTVGFAKEDFIYTTGKSGEVEIEADTYFAACTKAIKKLVESLPKESEVAAFSAISASGNVMLLDDAGNAITPIYNWRDTRTTDEVQAVLGDFDYSAYYEKTGWGFSGNSFPLAILCYIKVHNPELLDSCAKVCMSTEYLYYKLTSKWGIGTSAGTPFYLIDQRKGEYIKETLDVLGIDEDKLPPIMKTGSVLGAITKEAAKLTGLAEGTPVVLGTFDHPGAARGTGVLDEGELLLSCGTSWVGFFPIADRKKAVNHNMLIDPFLSPDGNWGAMFSLESVSDRIKLYIKAYISEDKEDFELFSRLADSADRDCGGLVIDIYKEPSDEIFKYSKENIARAIMEAIARLLLAKMDELKADGVKFLSATMVGGPSEDPVWHRVLSEVTGISVGAGKGAYAGASGAVILAGIGAGIYKDEKDAINKFNI